MTAAQLRSTMRVLVLAVVVVVPLAFWYPLSESFEVVKATVLWIVGLLVLATTALYLTVSGIRQVPRSVLVVVTALLAALVLTTVTSMAPIRSLVGQPGRYTGLATYVCLVGLLLATCLSFGTRAVRTYTWVCTLVALPVANYALLQVSGHDPFAWGGSSFSNYWMSTLANPNVASAFAAIVLPLIAYTMLRDDAPAWVTVLAGAAFGSCTACLSVFSSFQGPVAALTTVLFLGAWAVWTRATLGGWIMATCLAGSVVVVPTFPPSAALIVVSTSATAGLLILKPYIARIHAPASWRVHWRRILLGAGGAAAVVAAAGSGRAITYAQQGWSSGFLERGDFYRTAINIFRHHPVLGSGLETYGLLFTRMRPEGHAVRFEQWISTSTHSVPLGMFANGGLVLGVAYLAFVGFIAAVVVCCLRRTSGHERVLVGAIGASWLAFQVQSLVSIESVALFSMHFVTSGLIVALAIEFGALRAASPGTRSSERDCDTAAPTIAEGQHDVGEPIEAMATATMQVGGGSLGHPTSTSMDDLGAENASDDAIPAEALPTDDATAAAQRRVSPVLVVATVALCAVVSWTVAARPARAVVAADTGAKAVAVHADGEWAIREFTRAVELAPWNNANRVTLADVEQVLGNRDVAVAGLTYVLRSVEGDPFLLGRAARVAFDAGDDELGLALLEQALDINPNGSMLREYAAGGFVKAGERAEAAGDIALARTRYQRALELMPGLAAAEDALADL